MTLFDRKKQRKGNVKKSPKRKEEEMMYTKPEKKGIKSSCIKQYIEALAKADLSTHSVLIARDGEIIFEKYWAPFKKDDLHRMYSATKSFVSIAIGFLEQDGMIELDDPIIKYFPDESKNLKDENMRRQTIRNMLMMSTAKVQLNWFLEKCEDRVAEYFTNDPQKSHPPGVVFEYDSTGSFILGTLVERLTKKSVLEYLREKGFDKIGFSKEAYMLTCPGGHSWSDSALMCRSSDLLKAAQFMLNGGSWNGEQLLNKDYVSAAVSEQIKVTDVVHRPNYEIGYGYQFWTCYGKSFWFNGMGAQIAMCVPEKNMVLVVNSDDEGNVEAKGEIINNFFDIIVANAQDTEVAAEGVEELSEYCDGLKLNVAKGKANSSFSEKINGVSFRLNKNPMGITDFRIEFNDDGGKFAYTNAQGDKEILFKMNENVFFDFPQVGYSDEIGSQPGKRLLHCAASAAWQTENQLFIKVQMLDTYLGRLNIRVAFDEFLNVILDMSKTAEDLLQEYDGRAVGAPKICTV